MILVAALWFLLGARVFSYASLPSSELHVIGWIVPGLISNTFERQGVLLTAASLVIVTVVAYFAGRILQVVAGV
jgi:hypothetical protein